MPALTLYGSSVASTTLSTANQLATTTGGTQTSTATTIASGNGYIEVRAQGGASTVNGSIPVPTGRGWLLDNTLLEGQTLSGGTFTAVTALSDTPSGGGAYNVTLRFYKRSSAGVQTTIGSLITGDPTNTNPNAVPFNTIRTTYNYTGTLSSMAFGIGDKLYVDEWINALGWSSETINKFLSNSATAGVTGNMQITTAGYVPTVTNLTATTTTINLSTDTIKTASSIAITETNAMTESVVVSTPSSIPVAGTPGGVRLLINDVYFPTILQNTINIDRTANDPIPTFKITLQDDPSQIALSELMEVVFIDAGQIANPTHNLLKNPIISPFATSWTQITATGGTFTQQSPGVKLTAANATATFGLSQITQNGLIMAGQSYMLSCFIQSSSLVAVVPFIQIAYLAPDGTVLSTQSLLAGTTSATNIQYMLPLQAPTGTASAQIEFGMVPTSGTNSGNSIFSSIQFEPMSFVAGNTQIAYPTPFCANGQQNCILMPDGTAIRQYRLFGGYITKATAGKYIGNNRQWTTTVSGYAWLLQKQLLLNNNYTNKTDSFIMKDLVAIYFPNQFNTAQVATGSTLDAFGYTANGTARDAFDALASNSNFAYIIGPYREIIYQAPGYNQLGFMLSDKPDNITSYPYYNYTRDIDGTQLGNATLVTGATGISAIEYDAQSIGYYNQKTNGLGIFWRTVSDSTITTTAAARQRAIAENTQYNYARPIVHLTTSQMMVPGYTVLFSSATDDLFEVPFIIQKSTLTLSGFTSLQVPYYECACDLGAFNPDMVNIIVRLKRQQLTNSNSVGTPVIGLMVTESATFVDSIAVSVVSGPIATYGMGIYGTSVYAFSVPSIPSTLYGTGTYGDSAHGYA